MLGIAASARSAPAEVWQALEPGLELGTFELPRRPLAGAAALHVLRVDPERFELRLVNASAAPDGTPASAREWASRAGLVAAINASMFQQDYRRSVSLMRTRDHVNQPRLSKDNAVLAFDRLDEEVPRVQIIDRTCQDFDSLKGRYGTLVQSIRMISCERANVWSQQPQHWSTAAIGIDGAGRVLMLHAAGLYTTHDLIHMLLELPLDVRSAMYVEGGTPAQLYVKAGGKEYEFVGRDDTGLLGSDGLFQKLQIPNVIGVARSTPAGKKGGP